MKFNQNKTKSALFLLILVLLTVMLSFSVLAFTKDELKTSASKVKSKIGNLFQFSEQPSTGDVVIFTLIFFAMVWIALSKMWGDGDGSTKSAIIVLSITLALALSIGLVYGGKFTVVKIFPFAMILLAVLLWAGLFLLFSKLFSIESVKGKVFLVIVTTILTIGIILLGSIMLCDNNKCEQNPFLKKVFGSESILGKIGLTGAGISIGSDDGPTEVPDDPRYVAASEFINSANANNITQDLNFANSAQFHIGELTALKLAMQTKNESFGSFSISNIDSKILELEPLRNSALLAAANKATTKEEINLVRNSPAYQVLKGEDDSLRELVISKSRKLDSTFAKEKSCEVIFDCLPTESCREGGCTTEEPDSAWVSYTKGYAWLVGLIIAILLGIAFLSRNQIKKLFSGDYNKPLSDGANKLGKGFRDLAWWKKPFFRFQDLLKDLFKSEEKIKINLIDFKKELKGEHDSFTECKQAINQLIESVRGGSLTSVGEVIEETAKLDELHDVAKKIKLLEDHNSAELKIADESVKLLSKDIAKVNELNVSLGEKIKTLESEQIKEAFNKLGGTFKLIQTEKIEKEVLDHIKSELESNCVAFEELHKISSEAHKLAELSAEEYSRLKRGENWESVKEDVQNIRQTTHHLSLLFLKKLELLKHFKQFLEELDNAFKKISEQEENSVDDFIKLANNLKADAFQKREEKDFQGAIVRLTEALTFTHLVDNMVEHGEESDRLNNLRSFSSRLADEIRKELGATEHLRNEYEKKVNAEEKNLEKKRKLLEKESKPVESDSNNKNSDPEPDSTNEEGNLEPGTQTKQNKDVTAELEAVQKELELLSKPPTASNLTRVDQINNPIIAHFEKQYGKRIDERLTKFFKIKQAELRKTSELEVANKRIEESRKRLCNDLSNVFKDAIVFVRTKAKGDVKKHLARSLNRMLNHEDLVSILPIFENEIGLLKKTADAEQRELK
ncbi:hypothetical protein HOK51_04040 [Candidatus Woesearchaeota archaeon]|jgi:hypothetical protein|nr:hypothetical protein [Candidatus Woesearchaeota archaeon]MBT6518992.1 hypothetical protein [Candidatus Woesearchaeota archaeon]MBT7368357.1 hypothetical protein [Candidatus Woesearchaeota archaeon]